MRRISFGLTIDQFKAGTKDVTRRLGWKTLRAGDRLLAVDRVMGFRKGERARVLGQIEVIDVRREPLHAITDEDVEREGFPGRDAEWFVAMFCRAMRCEPSRLLTRIEFRRLRVLADNDCDGCGGSGNSPDGETCGCVGWR